MSFERNTPWKPAKIIWPTFSSTVMAFRVSATHFSASGDSLLAPRTDPEDILAVAEESGARVPLLGGLFCVRPVCAIKRKTVRRGSQRLERPIEPGFRS